MCQLGAARVTTRSGWERRYSLCVRLRAPGAPGAVRVFCSVVWVGYALRWILSTRLRAMGEVATCFHAYGLRVYMSTGLRVYVCTRYRALRVGCACTCVRVPLPVFCHCEGAGSTGSPCEPL